MSERELGYGGANATKLDAGKGKAEARFDRTGGTREITRFLHVA